MKSQNQTLEGEQTNMETKTEEKTSTPSLDAAAPSNLAAPSTGTVLSPWQPPTWDQKRRELARKSVCPPATTDDEFDFFMAWCMRTGLDPFIQQAYLVPRRVKDAQGNWVEKMQPQAAVGGMAARADALPDFRGMRSGIVYAGDEFMVDENAEDSKTAITHRWSLEARIKSGGKDWKKKPIGAWAHIQRVGRAVPVTYLTLEERKPLKNDGTPLASPFWTDDKAPAQLRKCCEAEQYRKGYPNIFGGTYIGGEMEHAQEREVNEPPATPKTPTGKSDALRDRLGVKPVAKPTTVDAAAVPNPDAKPEAKKAPAIDEVRFGPLKGKKIVDCSTTELADALSVAHQQLANSTGKESWLKSVKEGVDAIDAEIDLREKGGAVDEAPAADAKPATRQPGEEG